MSVLSISPDVARANALWDELRSLLVRLEDVVDRIIEERAWEPLGYRDFAEAWADRMQGTRLATARQAATVVYALLDAGQTRDEITETLGPGSGVGPAKVEVLARQHSNGVPAALATTSIRHNPTVVRSHYRDAPSRPRTLHVELTEDEYAHLKALCEKRGLDPASEAQAAVRALIARLESR